MPEPTLLIRADASAEIGSGHVMRCLALAQAWQEAGGQAFLALASGAELEERIRSAGVEVAKIRAAPGSRDDAGQTEELCARLRADWLVIDGYHFAAEYRRRFRSLSTRLLLLDDDVDSKVCECDLVVNPDPDAVSHPVPLQDGTIYLGGPQYALLRRDFLQFRRRDSDVPETARRILVTLGGGDSANVTGQVFEALEDLNGLDLQVTVVVGASYPHTELLQRAVNASRQNANLLKNVENMPELMSRADLATTGGGGTCYELAFMRVPMFLITLAANHTRAVKAYAAAGAAFDAGWYLSLNRSALAAVLRKVICDCQLRARMAMNASRMVDGNGAERVVDAMNAISRRGGKVPA